MASTHHRGKGSGTDRTREEKAMGCFVKIDADGRFVVEEG